MDNNAGLDQLRRELRQANDIVAATRARAEAAESALATAQEAFRVTRDIARTVRDELEEERRQNAKLRDHVADLEKQALSRCERQGHAWQVNRICAECGTPVELLGSATGKHPCPACDGPNGFGTQTACNDCEPGIGNPLRERPS